VVVNEARVNVTDAFYRISMKGGYDVRNLAFSFLNTLSFIFTELEGRYYGGGVLELVPNEFKGIPVPYLKPKERDLKKLDSMLRDRKPLDSILAFTDGIILKDHLKLSADEIEKVRRIYTKLINRRLKIGK
jgi:adenine-specific DNA-methyltransferase